MLVKDRWELSIVVQLGGLDDWKLVNETVAKVLASYRHHGVTELGAGTGFGRRDVQFSAPSEAILENFEESLCDALRANGFDDGEVESNISLEEMDEPADDMLEEHDVYRDLTS